MQVGLKATFKLLWSFLLNQRQLFEIRLSELRKRNVILLR